MRLAATEIRLQVDDRGRVVVAGQPADRPADEIGQTFGEVGAAKELDRVGVAGILFTAEGHLV